MRFDHTEVTIEVVVGLDFESDESYVSSIKVGDKEVDFGIKNMWLCDLESEGYVTFPKEPGRYRIHGIYDDYVDTIVELYSTEKIG